MKKILPTPYKLEKSEIESDFIGFSEIRILVGADETIECAVDFLKEKFDISQNNSASLTFCKSDDEFFNEKNAKEQGYILVRDGDSVNLYAQSSVGFLYGAVTLLQLYGKSPNKFAIYDKPQIRFRGNMNTLWAETSVWSYDFGDGIEACERRLKSAIDDMVRAKLNLLYADSFGFRSERFDGYNDFMTRVSEYAEIRGMRIASGGYTMGYGMSANYPFMGEVFRNRYPYPDGEIYDCLGSCERGRADMPVEEMLGRSYGTCISNLALTDAKIAEIREYLKSTGVSVLYAHNMDADEIQEPLWLGRCDMCKDKYPNDSLYAKDGAAGAFANFYDRILDSLLPDFPNLIICAVSPGYAYHIHTADCDFEKSRKFWSSVAKYMRNKSGLIPMFRELFVQKKENRYRFDMIDEMMSVYGCVYFSSGDGFYSDKCYTPSAVYVAAMKNAELVICANGGALQKPTQYANAEYLWNPTASAFYNAELDYGYDRFTEKYNSLREGKYRPGGIYGKDGLLERSCSLLFGDKCGRRVADVFRLRGKNNECPIFTACNVEIWTNHTRYNLPFNWDVEINNEMQTMFLERFSESALVTESAREILTEIIAEGGIDENAKEHLLFLEYSAATCAKLCRLLTRYMNLYIEADCYFKSGVPYNEDIVERAESVAREAESALEKIAAENLLPFDVYGGIFTRREEIFEFISYSSGQIIKSILSNKRIPDEKRALKSRNWW